MPKKNSFITFTDQFCGAGGSSQGVRSLSQRSSGGIEIKLALNHWKLAIETHNTNFPDTIHDCTDISAADPRRYPSTDILITSPECTNHSLAKGKKVVKKQMDLFMAGKADAAAERSRATMWDVPRFAEYHEYNAIIVENVVDARKWVMFDAWLIAMQALGYMHKCVYLNSMHCLPTPQSRDRMYIVFWKKGNKAPNLEYTPNAWCPKCQKDTLSVQTWKRPDVRHGKYKQQYVYCCPGCSTTVEPYYYAAFNCIDWTDPGTRIGDRPKPLAPNSITRIQYGLDKYGDKPMMVVNYSPGYCKPVTEPSGTMTSRDSHGLLTPFVVNDQYSSGVGCRVRSSADKLDTITGTTGLKLLTPFVVKLEHSQRDNNVRPVNEASSTQNARRSAMLISPYSKSSTEPLHTQTTCQGMGMVVPYIVEMNSSGKARTTAEPACTVTAGGNHHGLVRAPFLTISRGKSMVGDPMKALNTVSSGGIHTGIVTGESWNGFVTSYYNGSNCTKHITEPTGTVTAGDRLSLVNYQKPNIEDCYYRMLKAPEIKLAMAFDREYTVLGNSRDQVKQLGNAVTPPAMEWLAQQVVESFN